VRSGPCMSRGRALDAGGLRRVRWRAKPSRMGFTEARAETAADPPPFTPAEARCCAARSEKERLPRASQPFHESMPVNVRSRAFRSQQHEYIGVVVELHGERHLAVAVDA